jgi:hypothetical protein
MFMACAKALADETPIRIPVNEPGPADAATHEISCTVIPFSFISDSVIGMRL